MSNEITEATFGLRYPDLKGTPEQVAKATKLRKKALDRTPSVWFLMDELTDASWWVANSRRFHHPNIWCELVSFEESNELYKWLNDELWGP